MYKIKWLQIEMLDILKYLLWVAELLILAASIRKDQYSTYIFFPTEALRKNSKNKEVIKKEFRVNYRAYLSASGPL